MYLSKDDRVQRVMDYYDDPEIFLFDLGVEIEDEDMYSDLETLAKKYVNFITPKYLPDLF